MSSKDSNFGAACLPRTMPSLHGRHCWVAGWGVGTEGGNAERLLNEVGVNVFSHEYCVNKSIYGNFIIEEAEICAGIPDRNNDGLADGGKDACQGDSGNSSFTMQQTFYSRFYDLSLFHAQNQLLLFFVRLRLTMLLYYLMFNLCCI